MGRSRGKLSDRAFAFWAELGPQRSYAIVSEKFGVTVDAVRAYARRHRWAARLKGIEQRVATKTEDHAVETLDAMTRRHLKQIRVIQMKALAKLSAEPLSTTSEAVRGLQAATQCEREIRGLQPGEGLGGTSPAGQALEAEFKKLRDIRRDIVERTKALAAREAALVAREMALGAPVGTNGHSYRKSDSCRT